MMISKRLVSLALIFLAMATIGSSQSHNSIKVDVDLVTVTATVTDTRDHPIVGLRSQHFQLWEDKVQQEIESFSQEDVPATFGILLDVSGSMENTIGSSRDAAVTFLKLGNRDDEYFLIEFADR